MLLTTAQAAEMAGTSLSGFRTLAARARAAGVELQAPKRNWPDGRTPVYPADALMAYLASRPGRGRRTQHEDPQRSEPNGGEQLQVNDDGE